MPSTQETLDTYVRHRAEALGFTVSQVCIKAGISRQTFYTLAQIPARLPDLKTVVALADVLKVHPLRLLHLVFDALPMTVEARKSHMRGDQSAFVSDVTYPDGALVMPKQVFTKTWALQNVGIVPWVGRYLQCMDDDVVVLTRSGEMLTIAQALQAHVQRIEVPDTAPGETVELSVDFTAPSTPCTVVSYWKSFFTDGEQCFPDSPGLWCKVQVNTWASSAQVKSRTA